jgi:pilus assembly protein CpaC
MQLISRFAVRNLLVAALAGATFVTAEVPALAQAQAANALRVSLTAGRSTVLNTDFDVTRIAVTNPLVADAVVVQPREILVDGKAPGTISLIVWGNGTRLQYDLVVEQPTTPLEQQLHQIFPA